MNTTLQIVLAAAMLTACAGCADVRVRQPASSQPPAAAYATVDDGRSADQLAADNGQLRSQLARCEADRLQWKQAVEGREEELKAAKNARDAMKKDRDRARKALDD